MKLNKELKAILNGSTKIDRAAVTGSLSTIVGRLVSTRNTDMKARQSCHAHLVRCSNIFSCDDSWLLELLCSKVCVALCGPIAKS